MAGMNYGRRLREALPPMGSIVDERQAMSWLSSLASGEPPW
jgi:ATP-dependent DNA helicase DinG